MIASRFNLDHRLAELRQTRTTEFADRPAAASSTSPASRMGAVLRSLVGGASASRTVRVPAH